MAHENSNKSLVDYADDAVLWEQVKNGDKLGMEGLYVKYAHQLFRLGMSIKNDRSFIKDCIHEVFLNIWQYRHSLKDTDNVKLYLFKCLSNKIYKDVGKDKRRYGQESIDSYEASLTEDILEYEQGSNQIDEKKRLALMNAMAALPMRQKEVIQYLFFEAQSYEDTSKIMGINVQSVYTLAWKAISNLKKKLMVLVFLFTALFS
jgi:RNA polymerase sigma factor (sigma-70 family)